MKNEVWSKFGERAKCFNTFVKNDGEKCFYVLSMKNVKTCHNMFRVNLFSLRQTILIFSFKNPVNFMNALFLTLKLMIQRVFKLSDYDISI